MAHRWQVARLLDAGAAVPRDRAADGRVDDDGDARGALAAPRRGRLPAGARPARSERARRPPDDRRPRRRGGCASRRSRCSSTPGSGPRSPASARSRSRAATRRSTCCSSARPTSPSTCRTASSTAASRAPTSSASAAPHVEELLRLGFGSCTLEAAVPEESPCAGARRARRACAVATVYPRLARELLAERGSTSSSSRSPARSRSRRGSGSPTRSSTSCRAGTRCARTACARSASLFSSEAVLIGRAGDATATAARRDAAQRRRRARARAT